MDSCLRRALRARRRPSPGRGLPHFPTSPVQDPPFPSGPASHTPTFGRLSIEEAPSDGIPVWSHFSIKVVIRDANLHKVRPRCPVPADVQTPLRLYPSVPSGG